MQPDEFLVEVRQHLILSNNEFATPICDAKLKEFAEGLLAKVTPALELALTPDEKWNIAKTARDAFRAKIESLRDERLAEFQELDKKWSPWRYQAKAAPSSACSVPDSLVPTVKKVEEIF
jgi:hypothetical protein